MATYDDQIKAQALAMIMAGNSIGYVASQLGIPIGTLKSWKQRDIGGQERPDASEKRDRIGGLLLRYLEVNLETLTAQSLFFRNAEYLQKQSAGELAVLHGVIADKSIRLLEALAEPDPAVDDAG